MNDVRISRTPGPWTGLLSLGVHMDLEKRYTDIHLGPYVVTIGSTPFKNVPTTDERPVGPVRLWLWQLRHWRFARKIRAALTAIAKDDPDFFPSIVRESIEHVKRVHARQLQGNPGREDHRRP